MTVSISVFIPVWNDAKWLPGAIESVLGQSHKSWELIIGDNASTDDLRVVVDRYKDPRIVYWRWPTHTGIYENFNRTMLLCRFDWVQALGADDRLNPLCLEKIAARIVEMSTRTGRLAMVLTNLQLVGEDGQPVSRVTYYGVQKVKNVHDGVYSASQWMALVVSAEALPWNIGSVAIAREVLSESGGFFRPEVGLCSDIELVTRVAAYGDVVFIDEPLLHYTTRSDSDRTARFDLNRSRGYRLTTIGAAYLSALQAHEERRVVTPAERDAVYSAVARSHLRRAINHRYLRGGHGRRGAFADLARAFVYSPGMFVSGGSLAIALAALFAPRLLLTWAHARLLKRLAA
jgi:glycosyltransferase involved in cell wall biosynthesis